MLRPLGEVTSTFALDEELVLDTQCSDEWPYDELAEYPGPPEEADKVPADELQLALGAITMLAEGPITQDSVSFKSTPEVVAQDTCLAVVKALPDYVPRGTPFINFVDKVAFNRLADTHRSISRDHSDPVANIPETVSNNAGPEDQALASELRTDLHQLLMGLSPKYRDVVLLRVIADMDGNDTARHLDLSPEEVRVYKQRALARLLQLITIKGLADINLAP